MINPLVYEVHDDNDPRHFYMHDPVSEKVGKLNTLCPEYNLKNNIIKYIPVCILNELEVPVSMIQSISFKFNHKARFAVSHKVHGSRRKDHIITIIKSDVMIKIQLMRKVIK